MEMTDFSLIVFCFIVFFGSVAYGFYQIHMNYKMNLDRRFQAYIKKNGDEIERIKIFRGSAFYHGIEDLLQSFDAKFYELVDDEKSAQVTVDYIEEQDNLFFYLITDNFREDQDIIECANLLAEDLIDLRVDSFNIETKPATSKRLVYSLKHRKTVIRETN